MCYNVLDAIICKYVFRGEIMINITECTYSIYGRCVSITNGRVEIRVTRDIGPRIIYLSIDGEPNMMFEDRDDAINSKGDYFDTNFKKGEAWHIYGGHRLWKSEEEFATYAPDNYPVDVKYLDNGAIFTAPTEKMTGLTKTLTITMAEDGTIAIEHKFKNDGSETFKGALWALSVMAPGSKVYVPLNTADTGWLSNRNIVLWSYDDVNDHRLTINNDGIRIVQDATVSEDNNLKIGTFTPMGYVYNLQPCALFRKTLDSIKEGMIYPDNMCNVEVYTSFRMAEIETLSPMYTLAVGEEATHTEKWNVYAKDSDEYKAIAAKF